MRLMQRLLIVLIPLLGAVVGVWPVQGDSTGKKKSDKPEAATLDKAESDDNAALQLEKNRKRLATMRKDPEYYARLLRDLRNFLSLTPKQQDRLRKLDQELHQLDKPKADKLNRALNRYADWLERLSEADRKYVETAPDGKVRVQRIKELREKEWIEQLPKAKRDQVYQAQGKERRALINKFRREEQQNKQKWEKPLKHWDELLKGSTPSKASELPQENPTDVQVFIDKVLQNRLESQDRERFTKAEGHWPAFPETLVELADKYVPFPGPVGPRTLRELPPELQRRVAQIKPNTPRATYLGSFEGHWPDYAVVTAIIARNQSLPLPPRQYPAKPADFGGGMPSFVQDRLMPTLNAEEKRRLRDNEGRWPEYPKALADLAHKHNLPVPGMLPGSPAYWDKYRPPKPVATAPPKPPASVDAAKKK
jgi:hypothetical protein